MNEKEWKERRCWIKVNEKLIRENEKKSKWLNKTNEKKGYENWKVEKRWMKMNEKKE